MKSASRFIIPQVVVSPRSGAKPVEEVESGVAFLFLSPGSRVTGSVQQLTNGEMSIPSLELKSAISAAVKYFSLAKESEYLQYSSTGLPGRLIGYLCGRALITVGVGEFCDSSISNVANEI